MSSLCIIPARGGSKRIPRKNINEFLGKPIISYSIQTALDSALFDEVMVSTDDNEIQDIALSYGASVPFIRSAECSNDTATTMAVINEVVEQYHTLFNRAFDYICCLYPTSPLTKVTHLKDGLFLLKQKEADCVFPIVPFSYPVWRGVQIIEGKTKMIWKEYESCRSQDLPIVYHDAGQWYWLKKNRVDVSLFTDNTRSIVLKEEEVQDIDTASDWTIAEMKYRLMHG
jgi:pseudaminic acid cytidylyltransferase